MQSQRSLKNMIKSGISLKFSDPKFEEKFQSEKKMINFKLFRIILLIYIVGVSLAIMIDIIIGEDGDVELLKECKNGEYLKYRGANWKLILFPLGVFVSILELIFSCIPFFQKLRAFLSMLFDWVILAEPFIYQLSDLLPQIALVEASAFAMMGLILKGALVSQSWISASVVNLIGSIYSGIRLTYSTQVSLHDIYFPLFLLNIMFPIIFYYSERKSRKEYELAMKYKKQEEKWREFINRLPLGIIISYLGELYFHNEGMHEIFSNESRKPHMDKDTTGECYLVKHPKNQNFEEEKHDDRGEVLGVTPNILETEEKIQEKEINIQEMGEIKLDLRGGSPSQHTEDILTIDEGNIHEEIERFRLRMEGDFQIGRLGEIKEEIIEIINLRSGEKSKKYLEIRCIYIESSIESECIAIIVSDRTAQKTIQLAIMKAAKGKEMFFASMSHELRNPLNALLGSLEILKDTVNSDNEDVFQIAKTCGETLLNLIGNILDISKIESNKLLINSQPGRLKDTITRVITMTRALSSQKGLYLKLKWSKLLPEYMYFDHTRLTQVLLNLISNSIKFTDKGGVVVKFEWHQIYLTPNISNTFGTQDPVFIQIINNSDLREFAGTVTEVKMESARNYKYIPTFQHKPSTFEEIPDTQRNLITQNTNILSIGGEANSDNEFSNSFTHSDEKQSYKQDIHLQGYLKIQVIDTGCGIKNCELNKLFEPFGQTSNSNLFGGTGLGLWISRKIIQLMQGDIRIDSEEQIGSNFIILIPMRICSADKLLPRRNLRSSKALGVLNLKCLFVEDDVNNRKIVKEMLERKGLIVYTAENGQNGLQILKDNHQLNEEKFGIILTDLRMPIMSGQEMIKNIRAYEKFNNIKQIPIIILSGEPSELEINHCIDELKANAFMNKPLNINQLVEKIYQLTLQNIQDLRPEESKQIGNTIILIVDDDLFCAEMTSKIFEKNNLNSCKAHNISQGIRVVKERYREIGIILLDSQLPDGKGSDMARDIRHFEVEEGLNVRGLPIISISGDDKDTQIKHYEGIHIVDFMQKPVILADLVEIVKLYLEQNKP